MLLLPQFDYHEPPGLQEALKLVSSLNGEARPIAGGTDILVKMKQGAERPRALVSLGRVTELAGIRSTGRGLSVGPLVTAAELKESPVIGSILPALAQAASTLGSPLIRNRATIGGNLATARPAADLPPALISYDAQVKITSLRGAREVSLGRFFLGPGRTVLAGDELIEEIIVDEPPPFTGAEYMKLGHRNALEIAIVAVASRITLESPDGRISGARIVLSSVAPTAVRASSAEAMLVGQTPTPELFERAAAQAATECTPITDIRGGAGYRCAMVEVLTRRTLAKAFDYARMNRGRNDR
jgi:carbon-monoxide dehydrogenase medium subunit